MTASRISRDRVRKIRFFQPDAYVSVDYAAQEVEGWRLRRRDGERPAIEGGPLPVEQRRAAAARAGRFRRAPCATARAPLVDGAGRPARAGARAREHRGARWPDRVARALIQAMMFTDLNDVHRRARRRNASWRASPSRSARISRSAPSPTASRSRPAAGPALLFERPTGFDMPVAVEPVRLDEAHLPGARRRSTLDDLAHEIEELTTPKMPRGFMDALKMLPLREPADAT